MPEELAYRRSADQRPTRMVLGKRGALEAWLRVLRNLAFVMDRLEEERRRDRIKGFMMFRFPMLVDHYSAMMAQSRATDLIPAWITKARGKHA